MTTVMPQLPRDIMWMVYKKALKDDLPTAIRFANIDKDMSKSIPKIKKHDAWIQILCNISVRLDSTLNRNWMIRLYDDVSSELIIKKKYINNKIGNQFSVSFRTFQTTDILGLFTNQSPSNSIFETYHSDSLSVIFDTMNECETVRQALREQATLMFMQLAKFDKRGSSIEYLDTEKILPESLITCAKKLGIIAPSCFFDKYF